MKDVPNPHYFPESPLAHKYLDGLTGLEIGASSHNGFGLAGSLNVAPADDAVFHQAEIEMCGHYAKVDMIGEADDIPVELDSQDYVISSHVLEHLPDLFAAFEEWDQIVKPGGFIFMIVPKRDAHPPDKDRPISPVSQVLRAWNEGWSMEKPAPAEVLEAAGGIRGHYWVFTLESLIEIIECAKVVLSLDWEIVATEETDSKAGNGHTVVIQKRQFPGLGIVGDVSEKLDDDTYYSNPRGAQLSSMLPAIRYGLGPQFPSTSDIQKMPKRAGWPEARLDDFKGPKFPVSGWTTVEQPTPEESDLVQALHDEPSSSEKFLNSFATDDEGKVSPEERAEHWRGFRATVLGLGSLVEQPLKRYKKGDGKLDKL